MSLLGNFYGRFMDGYINFDSIQGKTKGRNGLPTVPPRRLTHSWTGFVVPGFHVWWIVSVVHQDRRSQRSQRWKRPSAEIRLRITHAMNTCLYVTSSCHSMQPMIIT